MTPAKLAERLRDGGQWCPADLFTDERGVAYLLGCSARTVRAWRRTGKGPRWGEGVARITYDLATLAAWYEEFIAGAEVEASKIGND